MSREERFPIASNLSALDPRPDGHFSLPIYLFRCLARIPSRRGELGGLREERTAFDFREHLRSSSFLTSFLESCETSRANRYGNEITITIDPRNVRRRGASRKYFTSAIDNSSFANCVSLVPFQDCGRRRCADFPSSIIFAAPRSPPGQRVPLLDLLRLLTRISKLVYRNRQRTDPYRKVLAKRLCADHAHRRALLAHSNAINGELMDNTSAVPSSYITAR